MSSHSESTHILVARPLAISVPRRGHTRMSRRHLTRSGGKGLLLLLLMLLLELVLPRGRGRLLHRRPLPLLLRLGSGLLRGRFSVHLILELLR